MITPLKALGLKEAAAAMVDLAGFRPISQAVAASFLFGAITRPMHYWGNSFFMPEIPPPRDLERWAQKRLIDLPTYRGLLQFHGFRDDDREVYTQAVWRDPRIFDLATALQDTTVDSDWLLDRVKRAGYSDDDAPHLVTALLQRANTSSRGKVITAAVTLYQNGLITDQNLTETLTGLGLRADQISLEVQAARLKAVQDAANDAITTYKKQFSVGLITQADLEVALVGLGMDANRVNIIVADQVAAITPKIHQQEQAAITEAQAAVRRDILPRVKALYLAGQTTSQDYVGTMLSAGIAPELAQQILALDNLRRGIGTPPGNTA
jgi:hypothetical protein